MRMPAQGTIKPGTVHRGLGTNKNGTITEKKKYHGNSTRKGQTVKVTNGGHREK